MGDDDVVRLIPLGGFGEIGKNSLAVETVEDLLLIDAGVKFPEEEMYGIDLILPDFSYVLENAGKLRGVVLTHGHEDHIGALAYLLRQLGKPVAVFGSPLTLGLAEVKLREHRVLHLATLKTIRPGEHFAAGRLQVEFVAVGHTVPDSVSISLTTPAGTIFLTSDFKFGEVDGEAEANVARLRQIGDQGVVLLVSDCVRVERAGRTPPERVVNEALDRIIKEAPARVIVTTFASNISRLAAVIRTAHRHGRRSAIAGRSIEQNLAVAREMGYLDVPAEALIPLDEANKLPPEQVVLLTTGSQGEPTSVLARIAVDDYPLIHLLPLDTVVISATPVPGNEETVSRTIDNLFRRGALVIYSALQPDVHVSGHASRDELREMIELIKPRFCLPAHGEYRMMVLYQELAAQAGIPRNRILLADIGDVLEIRKDSVSKVGRIDVGSVLVDGLTVGTVNKDILRERGRLAEDGVIVAAVAISRESGALVAGPYLMARGFTTEDDLLDRSVPMIVDAVKGQQNAAIEYGFLVAKIRQVLGKFIYTQTRRRPMILPVVTEV